MAKFGARLKKKLDETGSSQAEVAKITGMTRPQISRLIKTDGQPRNALQLAEKLSGLLKVNTNWLAFGLGSEDGSKATSTIPVFSGNDLTNSIKDIHFTEGNRETYFAYIVETDALKPEIPRGSIAIVNKQYTPKDGCYILLKNNNGDILIRTIEITPDGYTVKTSSNSFSCSKDDVSILGVITEFRMSVF